MGRVKGTLFTIYSKIRLKQLETEALSGVFNPHFSTFSHPLRRSDISLLERGGGSTWGRQKKMG
jgi:hypothetical protein